MSQRTLTILGIYRPQIPPETWQEQWAVTESDEETEWHFGGLVLIEATITGLEGETFDMGSFGQSRPGFPEEYKLVGYDEALLSADGEQLLQRNMDCVSGSGTVRFAAYLHEYDPKRPIEWAHGEIMGPPIEDAPERLMRLVPYTPHS